MIELNFLNNDYRDKRTQAEKISENIMIEILTGNLKPGYWLTEKYLTDKYKISRTPIREILNKLTSSGLIELIPNRGCFVKNIQEHDIDDYFNLSYLLYPTCVKWAIERITKEELDSLKEVFSFIEFYTKQNDLEKMKVINHGFNLIIYDACKNKEMEKLLKLYDFILFYGTSSIPYPLNYLESTLEENRQIYDAFIKRDPNLGYDAAQIVKYKQILRRKL